MEKQQLEDITFPSQNTPTKGEDWTKHAELFPSPEQREHEKLLHRLPAGDEAYDLALEETEAIRNNYIIKTFGHEEL